MCGIFSVRIPTFSFRKVTGRKRVAVNSQHTAYNAGTASSRKKLYTYSRLNWLFVSFEETLYIKRHA